MTMKTPVVLALFALVTIGTGYSVHRWLDSGANTPGRGHPVPEVARTLTQLPRFVFPDLQGAERSSEEWLGKVLVVNFWATWCPPCLREIPSFVDLQEQHGTMGLQFVGIAIDDADQVREFLQTTKVNYPVLLGDTDAIELSRLLGNRFSGLPYTAVFDRTGKLVYVQAGEMTPKTLNEQAINLL